MNKSTLVDTSLIKLKTGYGYYVNIIIIPKAGHSISIEQPEVYIKSILEFFAIKTIFLT